MLWHLKGLGIRWSLHYSLGSAPVCLYIFPLPLPVLIYKSVLKLVLFVVSVSSLLQSTCSLIALCCGFSLGFLSALVLTANYFIFFFLGQISRRICWTGLFIQSFRTYIWSIYYVQAVYSCGNQGSTRALGMTLLP